MTAKPSPVARPALKLGTRGSPLALAQARMVRDALCAEHGLDQDAIEIVPIVTDGDRIQDRPLADIGGKALWTKTLDRALSEGRIDFAVHSMKDVETERPAALTIAAMLPRADPRDRLIGADTLAALPAGAVVGTSSPRRAAFVRRHRPDVMITGLRGNVATRMARVAAGDVDATLLAAAGLDRLGHGETGVTLDIDVMLPAAAQGAIGIECLLGAEAIRSLLAAIGDAPTMTAVTAERRFLAALGADCHAPVAAHAMADGAGLSLRAAILSEDGSEWHEGSIACDDADAPAALAAQLLDRASPALRQLFDR